MDETRDHPVKWDKQHTNILCFLSSAKSGFKIYIYMHVYLKNNT